MEIDFSFYFSEPGNLNKFCEIDSVYLAHDEVEHIVGRFANHSSRAGQLRGKAVFYIDGSWQIRKSFGNKLLFDEINGLTHNT